MGVYTTIYKECRCTRCGGEYLCDFQIKTGDDACQHFKDGELVPKLGPKYRGTYRATFHPFCNVCNGFMNREQEELRKLVRDTILEMGYELRLSGYDGWIFKNGRQIGEYFNGMIFTSTRGKEFQKLEKVVVERLERQIRAAALEDFLRVERMWNEEFSWVTKKKGKVYRAVVRADSICEGAEITIGKRFKVKVLEHKVKDPRGFLDGKKS